MIRIENLIKELQDCQKKGATHVTFVDGSVGSKKTKDRFFNVGDVNQVYVPREKEYKHLACIELVDV